VSSGQARTAPPAGPGRSGPPLGRPGGPGGPSGSARPSFRKATGVFRNRHYRYLWTSSLFSFTGMQMQMIARALLAWELTHSFGAVGAVSLSFGLPMLFFALIGGGLADRLEKRNLTLATQTSSAFFGLLLALLVTTDTITIEYLFIIGLFSGTVQALGMPARTPLMAEVVGQDQVMSAIAMSNAAMNATRLAGPALAGAMAGVWGLEVLYFTQAGFNILSCMVLLMVPTGLGSSGAFGRPPRGNMFAEIAEGLRYAATHPRLRMLIAMMFAITFFAMPHQMLLAGFVQEDLGKGRGAYGIMQSVSGAGALIGSLGIATLSDFDRKPLVQWLSGVMGGVGLLLLAAGTAAFGYWGGIGAIAVLGFTLTAYQTINSTMLMDEAQPEYYGRVMSISMLTFSSMPLMAYPLGILADRIGARETFVGEGILVLGLMGIVALVNARYTFSRLPASVRPVGPAHWASRPGAGGPGPETAPRSSVGEPVGAEAVRTAPRPGA